MFYHVHEIYYGEDGSIESWSKDPVAPMGETTEELREDIKYFIHAFRRPILEQNEIEGRAKLIPDNDEYPINEGHYFEFMDRSAVALEYIYQFLGSHPLARKEDSLKELYEKAEESLAKLYQEASRLEFDKSSS